MNRRFAAVSLLVVAPLLAQQEPGLRLFHPLLQTNTHLVDGQGTIVHTWTGTQNAMTVHISRDGSLLRGTVEPGVGIPGTTGRLQKIDLDGNITWDLLISDATQFMHHDIEELPNGNVLVNVVDVQTPADAVARGRDPALVSGQYWLPEAILEIEQTGPTTGQIVWEWHIDDHLVQDFDNTKPNFGVVSASPERMNINYPPVPVTNGDWNHSNGIQYDPINDWIVFSVRSQDEIWLIDHSTTTAEAATSSGGQRGKGGGLLWRWGNPAAYDRGTVADQQLFEQHDPRFIRPGYPGAGNLTIFNNNGLPGMSTVVEVELPVDSNGLPFIDPLTNVFGPAAPVWSFSEPGFYSSFVSSAQRLKNGNTLICSGQESRLFEVTSAGQTVWSYSPPGAPFMFQTHSIDRRLWVDTDTVSITAGGVIGCSHLADTVHENDIYWLLGSLTGTTPGTPLPGGLMLPLNFDVLLEAMATQPNIGILTNTMGLVPAAGRADSSVLIPPGLVPASLIGVTIDLAHVLIDGTGFAVKVSNVSTVTLTL